ncbi:hypothetical protein ACFL6Y_04410 [Elusimicrobiota bacterium]
MNDIDGNGRSHYRQDSAEYRRNGEEIVMNWNQLFKSIASIGRIFNHFPLAIIGLLIGGLVGVGAARMSYVKTYRATALFEMLPSPMRMVLEPLQTAKEAEANKQEEGEVPMLGDDVKLTEKRKQKLEGAMWERQKELREDERRTAINTYRKLLLSPQVQDMTAKKLEQDGIREMASFADAELVEDTNLLEIGAISKDPVVAYLTANAWAKSAIEMLINLNSQQFQMGKSFLWEQYKKSKGEILNFETKIVALKKKANLEVVATNLEAKKSALLANIKELEIIRAEVAALESELPAIEKMVSVEEETEEIQTFLNSKSRKKIRKKLLKRLERNPEQVKDISQYLQGSYDVAQVLNPVYWDLLETHKKKKTRVEILKPKKELYETSVTKLNKEVTELQVSLNSNQITLSSLEKDLEIARKQNAMIFGKVSEAELASAMRFADLRLMSYSAEPASPLPVMAKRKMAICASIGFFLGFMISFYFVMPYVQRRKMMSVVSAMPMGQCAEDVLLKARKPREPLEV